MFIISEQFIFSKKKSQWKVRITVHPQTFSHIHPVRFIDYRLVHAFVDGVFDLSYNVVFIVGTWDLFVLPPSVCDFSAVDRIVEYDLHEMSRERIQCSILTFFLFVSLPGKVAGYSVSSPI